MQQQTAFDILKSGRNVFLTGAAGSGKTHLLNRYIDALRKRGAKVAVTASTGIAATHLGGSTIHSWSGLGIRDQLDAHDLENIAKRRIVSSRVRQTRVLIIDEISMLSAQTLGNVDEIIRHLKRNPSPFGGIQVVFSGDFFQLPPVDRNNQAAHEKFAFIAPAWARADLEVCYLTESHRHEDDALARLLDAIRSGAASSECQNMLEQKRRQLGEHGDAPADENAVKLHTHNADVDAANLRKLEQLPGKEKQFTARIEGSSEAAMEALKRSVLAPECLRLKKDAQVMFVKNNPGENYMNGTLGRVVGFTDAGLPVVETFDGNRVTAQPAQWDVQNEQGYAIASYTQVPLRLAWAITVHKAQGMTLDRVAVDLSRTFEPGQGYVALSRVKTWDGLRILGYNFKALQVDALSLEEDKKFRAQSAQAQDKIARVSDAELSAAFEKHIIKSGGKKNAPAQSHRAHS